jgi:hypothetical protein
MVTASKTDTVALQVKEGLTPEQISFNMPIGVAMEAFFDDATSDDFRLKNKVYDALTEAIDSVRDEPGMTTRHGVMATLDFARVMLLAHAEHAQKSRT